MAVTVERGDQVVTVARGIASGLKALDTGLDRLSRNLQCGMHFDVNRTRCIDPRCQVAKSEAYRKHDPNEGN